MPTLSIIGGYLGTGKSTLVNRLLAGVLEGRTAVVVNDFGAVNIDASLISSRDEDTIELTNGCICCQISDDVQRTMSTLARREELSHVVCEVSGVGDPRQLGTWRQYPGFTAGPILVCADATATRRLLRDEFVGDLVERQLAAAETVLVTKADLATEAEIAETLDLVRGIAPATDVHVLDPAGPGAALRGVIHGVPGCPGAAGASDSAGSARSTPDDHTTAHLSTTVDCPGPVDVARTVTLLETLVPDLVRAKGVVRDAEGRWQVLHLAGGRVTSAPHPPEAPTPSRSSLVLIAAGAGAQERLARCAVTLRRG